MKPIAHIHTDLPQKFGIPRNSFLAPHLQGRIVFEPEYALNSAVAGIDSFSHLWLLWRFENGEPGGGAADVAGARAAAAAGERDAGVHGKANEAASRYAPAVDVPANAGARAAAAADGCDAGAHGEANAETPNSETAASAAAAHKTTPAAEDNASLNRKDAPAAGVPANAGSARGGTAADERTPAPTAISRKPARWSPTVRPPRLGGVERVGVFATRSPFRPNPIGLTCVKLDRVELTDAGPIIHVLGADLRDGTPIYDIKPYIPFADCHPDACGGWIEDAPWHELDVDFPKQLQAEVPAGKLAGLTEVLRQDPRRAGSKHEPTRVYHLAYAGLDVAFTVDGNVLHVVCVS